MNFAGLARYRRHAHQRCWEVWALISGEGLGYIEHPIPRVASMILRDRCSTLHDLASLCRGRRTLNSWSGKIATHFGTKPSTLYSLFYFWGKSRRSVSFLMLPPWKSEGVSRIFFCCCQGGKWWTSRSLAAFLMLWGSKMGKISQRVVSFSNVQVDKWMDGWMDK